MKLVRTEKREGLIRARVIGAENMSGDVIVILDAHCECVTNWLPPLLTRIAINRYIQQITYDYYRKLLQFDYIEITMWILLNPAFGSD